MKTVFVINPKAGRGIGIERLIDGINKTDADTEIYITKSVGDAPRFVKEYCESSGPARFIACGGDGTLNEILNGAVEFENAEIGVLPIGTGNDFCRNFSSEADFKDIKMQITGPCIKCDAIRYRTVSGEEGYCANMVNIGFDCNVADKMTKLKKNPLISGPFAYLLSIFINLITKNGADLKIEMDGITKHQGPLLLTSVANGSFCGGGIKSNPLAMVNDGFINVNIVNNVSRLKFLTLLPHYMKGTHMNLPDIENVITSEKCRKVVVTPLTAQIKISNDGEIKTTDKIEFEIVHNAFNFVLPSKKYELKSVKEMAEIK